MTVTENMCESTQTKRTKLCVTCNEVKPTAQFKRRLSLAQTRAFLRQPNATTRYWTDSKRCKECQLQHKRHRPLTIKEIRTKITSGDMHHVVGEEKIKRMRQAIPKRRSKVMKEYWQKKKLGWQDELKTNLQKQVTAYANRYYAYKNKLSDYDSPTPLQHATLDQHSYNYMEAKRVRQELLNKVRDGEEVDQAVKINELIKRRKVVQDEVDG